MLNDEITLHVDAGVGARGWAATLLNMYIRFAERNGYQCATGSPVGSTCDIITVHGAEAYRVLVREVGVHRYERTDPFTMLRKTSTARVTVESSTDQPVVWSTSAPRRDYVTDPYTMVVDRVSGKTTVNVAAVLDGDIGLVTS